MKIISNKEERLRQKEMDYCLNRAFKAEEKEYLLNVKISKLVKLLTSGPYSDPEIPNKVSEILNINLHTIV